MEIEKISKNQVIIFSLEMSVGGEGVPWVEEVELPEFFLEILGLSSFSCLSLSLLLLLNNPNIFFLPLDPFFYCKFYCLTSSFSAAKLFLVLFISFGEIVSVWKWFLMMIQSDSNQFFAYESKIENTTRDKVSISKLFSYSYWFKLL